MKKILKIIVIALFAAFLAIQFYRPARVNPEINPTEEIAGVPENVDKILQKSCNDCHTNNADWIWYSNIAPISWKMVEHVDEGRKEMNFSVWNTYKTKRKDHKLEEICEQVETREMPLPKYLWIHWGAKLTDEEIKTLCDWTKAEREKLKNES